MPKHIFFFQNPPKPRQTQTVAQSNRKFHRQRSLENRINVSELSQVTFITACWSVGKVFQLRTPSSDHLTTLLTSTPLGPRASPRGPSSRVQPHKEVLIASLRVAINLNVHYLDCRIHNVAFKANGR